MTAPSPLFALRLALRELRGGIGALRVFVAALVLGVATIAGIGSLAASLTAAIDGDARELLGGDVEAVLAYHPADPAEHAFLAHSGTLSVIATLRAMARTADGRRQSLIELRAVDRAYPLYGAVTLTPARPLDAALGRRDGRFGAVVAPAILGRLGLAVGDTIRIGEAALQLRATIASEPDPAVSGLVLGPRVMISAAALAATGLIQPGALVTYHYRLRLPAGTTASAWIATARAAFPEAGWELRSSAAAAPGLQRLIRQVALFLSLVGLTALLVGGVGIGNAVHFHLTAKITTIATLKCLGGSGRLVFAVYLTEILVLSLVAIAAGLAIGALVPIAARPVLAGLLPVRVPSGIHPAALGLAALFGLLTTLVFALLPLAAIGHVPAGALFRDRVDHARRPLPAAMLGLTAALALGLAALCVFSTRDRSVAAWFVFGALAAFVLFRLVASAIAAAARMLGRRRSPLLRLALANLCRPGAATVPVTLSLGIGLSVLVAVALVEGNFAREVETRLPEAAPAFFFIDIEPDQRAGFAAIVHAFRGAHAQMVPMLRGRITRLNGVPVERVAVKAQARWALSSDRGLTYSAQLPPGSRLVAGTWWPPDYHGPPLVSFDAGLAHGMGLAVGDTLSVNLLGREITARIANLRRIDWQRLGINFAIVFAPGTLEHAPQTILAAVSLPKADEAGLVRRVTERFANISAIPVREALAAVDRIVVMIGRAVGLTALVAVAAGALVLGGAVAAGHRGRVYDAVLLKVLGATRGMILAAFLVEYGLLGLVAALVAAAVGSLAAAFVVMRLVRIDWVFLPAPLLSTVLLSVLLTLAIGFAGTWRALGAKPAAYLRND
ncbi:MAG TPA: FtsX-like permease family protein [Stellaceae bacterium]|nr:FtsX-like permease family protein [Stellaceae bacterium]